MNKTNLLDINEVNLVSGGGDGSTGPTRPEDIEGCHQEYRCGTRIGLDGRPVAYCEWVYIC